MISETSVLASLLTGQEVVSWSKADVSICGLCFCQKNVALRVYFEVLMNASRVALYC